MTNLDNSFAANHVCSGTYRHGPSIGILDLPTRIDKLTQVIELGRAIRIRKHHVLTPNMP